MKRASTTSKRAPIQYINIKEAAVIFGCSTDTIVWWIKHDLLPAVKRGRIWYLPLKGVLRIKQNDLTLQWPNLIHVDLARPPPD